MERVAIKTERAGPTAEEEEEAGGEEEDQGQPLLPAHTPLAHMLARAPHLSHLVPLLEKNLRVRTGEDLLSVPRAELKRVLSSSPPPATSEASHAQTGKPFISFKNIFSSIYNTYFSIFKQIK